MPAPPQIQTPSIWHFLRGWGVVWAFVAALFNTVIGVVGTYAIKESLPKKWGKPLVICLTVVGVALPLTSAWQQASQDQQSDLVERQAQQAAEQLSDELASVKGAIIDKLPKPGPIHITELLPKAAAVTGMVPEVDLYFKNSGTSPQYMALQYRVFLLHNDNGCFDDLNFRRRCEQNLWAQFVTGLNPRRFYMEIPVDQDQEVSLTALNNVVQADENPTNTRFYFVVRALDGRGKKIFDSCSYIEPNPAPNALIHVTDCIAHND